MDAREAENLGYYMQEAARRFPDKDAIVDLSGGHERVFSYARLDRRKDRMASALAARGLKPGERVLLACGNRTEFVEAMFGAMRAGLVPVPVNTQQGGDVLAYIAENAECRGAILEPASNAHIAGIAERMGLAVRIAIGDGVPAGWEAFEDVLAGAALPFVAPALPEGALCFLPYTSGSTGRPKGVPLSHAGQLWWVHTFQRYWPASEDLRGLVAVPLYHKNAMAGQVKPRLYTGGSFVLMNGFEPRAFLEACARYRCTNISGVPTVFTLLLQQEDLLRDLDLSALQVAVVGSAPVHEALTMEMEQKLGVAVMQSYGLTEGGPVMLGPPLDGRPVPHGSCGVAWPEGEVKLVGADGREHRTDGELWVRNPGVPPGYYRLPEVNAQRYVDGWLRTGDLFRKDTEGFFYFQGRTDDMFNCGGENVYPREVENLLLTHPDVVDACVVAVPHKSKGEAPAALVVRRNGAAVDEQALRQFCIANGPAYAHPRRILFADALPLTGAKKVDRSGITKRLREQLGTVGA